MSNKIKFGRIFWPSFLATLIVSIIGIVAMVFIIMSIIGGLSDFKPEPLEIKKGTVLRVTLDGQIAERSQTKFSSSSFGLEKKIGLSELLYGFQKASEDDKIKGLFLEIGDLNCGYSTAREIRNAINEFEKSGKFVVAYNSGELISQKEYYIASAASENYGFPSSVLEFVGLGTEIMYFKNTLEKLDVEMQVIRGKNNDFKSAVEPYFRDKMSDSSRLQIERYLSSLWMDIRLDISKDRNISPEKLNEIAEKGSIRRAEDAVSFKLLDGLKYRDEVIDLMAKKTGNKKPGEINVQSFEKYASKKYQQEQVLTKADKPNIAVILSQGAITTNGEELTSKEICRLFREVRKDKNIKTVVFRVNSPGGSALASDEIWREVKLTNLQKKVIVSMGDVAASGGYYVSAPASAIFAEPTTITGSIGVFGVIPFTGKMFEEKFGLTFDRAQTNKFSVMSLNKKLTPEEIAVIQGEVDNIYTQFLSRVAEGRGMTKEQVNKIARGRVWTGRDALKIGLVDQLGGLTDAINFAAEKSSIKEKKVLYYPQRKDDAVSQILEQLEEKDNESIDLGKAHMPDILMKYYKELKKLESMSGMQMRLPYELIIH